MTEEKRKEFRLLSQTGQNFDPIIDFCFWIYKKFKSI